MQSNGHITDARMISASSGSVSSMNPSSDAATTTAPYRLHHALLGDDDAMIEVHSAGTSAGSPPVMVEAAVSERPL